MKFVNYPSESPFQQHILSQFWTNLLVDVLNIGVKYRPLRYPNPRTLDLDRGGKITNEATEKVDENLEYGMELTIYWWDWEDEPIWYLQPFARTFLPTGGTKVLRIGSGAIEISKGHGVGTIPLEAFEKLASRISQIEKNRGGYGNS